MDRIPNWMFRVMTFFLKIRDVFSSSGKMLEEFDIHDGQTVVDYGCGPGSYVGKASELAGPNGMVYAVDIHELAIEAINNKIGRENIANVKGVFAENGECPLKDNIADVIYALDMFHMVSEPTPFLQGLNRIAKSDGFLFIGNGHQSRQDAKSKILDSGAWSIVDENKKYMKCKPI